MNVSPMDMRQQRFRTALRGFDRTEVVAFLAEAADDYEQALRETDRLRGDLMRMEALLAEHREHESNLRDTLLTAQRLSDEIKENGPDRSQADHPRGGGPRRPAAPESPGAPRGHRARHQRLKLRRRDAEGSIEATIQTLYRALEFVREQEDARPTTRSCCTGRVRPSTPRQPAASAAAERAPESTSAKPQFSPRSAARQWRRRAGRHSVIQLQRFGTRLPCSSSATSAAVTCAGRRHGAARPARFRSSRTAPSRPTANAIVFAGPRRGAAGLAHARRRPRIDGRGGAVVPGFVDPHTHVVFAGDRRDELRRRLAGATYAEIAAAGGGIVVTVRATRAASASDALVDDTRRAARRDARAAARRRARSKSGYGLTTDERAEDAARDPRAGGDAADRSRRRRSWARTKSRPSTASAARDYVDWSSTR